MAFARTSLGSFLRYTKTSLAHALARGDKITFVIGNESADLDSFTSSILLAYIRSNAPSVNAFTRLYFPVLNIPAADINLRPEFTAVLSHANVNPQTLITLDDLPSLESLPQRLKPENTRWILVDHNALQGELGRNYAERVSGVIDHHDEENKVLAATGNEPRVIEKAGSCTSLVTNWCRDAWDDIFLQAGISGAALGQDDTRGLSNDRAFVTTWDAQIAKVALASILIDTSNLRNKDKVTKHDIDAAAYLEAKIVSSPRIGKDFSRDEYFEELSTAKQDIARLKIHDILRKDYKQWNSGTKALGVSSVVKDIDFLIDKAYSEGYATEKSEAFLNSVNAFAKDRNLGMFAVMTTSTSADGRFRRELFLTATNKEAIEAATKFERDSRLELGLADWHGSVEGINCSTTECWRKIWQQQEVQHSRKRVAPLLRQSLED